MASFVPAFDPTELRPGDRLDRDGTAWIVTAVDVRERVVVVRVDRLSCNGARGCTTVTIDRAAPLEAFLGADRCRHVRRVVHRGPVDLARPGHACGAHGVGVSHTAPGSRRSPE